MYHHNINDFTQRANTMLRASMAITNRPLISAFGAWKAFHERLKRKRLGIETLREALRPFPHEGAEDDWIVREYVSEFEEGTRQWAFDAFDAWIRSTRKPASLKARVLALKGLTGGSPSSSAGPATSSSASSSLASSPNAAAAASPIYTTTRVGKTDDEDLADSKKQAGKWNALVARGRWKKAINHARTLGSFALRSRSGDSQDAKLDARDARRERRRQRESRVFVISADAGVGKTAIVSKLIQLRGVGTDENLQQQQKQLAA